MDWFQDEQWKIKFPNQKVWMMREHNWAFAAWEMAKMNGLIQPKSTLVHVDSHLDDVFDGIEVAG